MCRYADLHPLDSSSQVDPKHFDLVPGLDAVRDHPKTFVCIDEFNNGHRAHQEEQNAADLLHVVEQPVFEELGQTTVPLTDVIGRKQMEFFREVGWHLMPTKDKQRPANRSCHQSRSGLVDVNVVFCALTRLAPNVTST